MQTEEEKIEFLLSASKEKLEEIFASHLASEFNFTITEAADVQQKYRTIVNKLSTVLMPLLSSLSQFTLSAQYKLAAALRSEVSEIPKGISGDAAIAKYVKFDLPETQFALVREVRDIASHEPDTWRGEVKQWEVNQRLVGIKSATPEQVRKALAEVSLPGVLRNVFAESLQSERQPPIANAQILERFHELAEESTASLGDAHQEINDLLNRLKGYQFESFDQLQGLVHDVQEIARRSGSHLRLTTDRGQIPRNTIVSLSAEKPSPGKQAGRMMAFKQGGPAHPSVRSTLFLGLKLTKPTA